MEYDVDIRRLSSAFFKAYPASDFPEIMVKSARPYTCLIIETHEDYLICIPFRSSIRHNDAFLFKNTHRARITRSGLDYKKVILIKDMSYIDSDKSVVLDNDEYKSAITNIEQIVNEVHSYILGYANHVSGINMMHEREFERHYRYSTLAYFHSVLGLE